MTSLDTRAVPSLRVVFASLFRADFLVFLKHRRALVVSLLLPIFILVSTNANKANAFGKCVSAASSQDADAQAQADSNAAKTCKAARTSLVFKGLFTPFRSG